MSIQNAKDSYDKVGVCGATIDTIQSRNFERMVVAVSDPGLIEAARAAGANGLNLVEMADRRELESA